jgi:anhydro-N-acetylmuramic acid kinase
VTGIAIGLMSGTSMDGIDAALVRFEESSLEVRASISYEYPESLRQQLQNAVDTPLDDEIHDLALLDHLTAECFRDAALMLIRDSGIDPDDIAVIGSHGQTVRHQPDIAQPYSLQIGDPGLIALATGIACVGDFRSADIEAGGQGAPLVPPFHHWLFHDASEDRVVVNIGGIANVTVLAGSGDVTGFDTGPGNTLMDKWALRHTGRPFDADGAFAAGGSVNEDLLERLLHDPYFAAPPPKSTGLEYFNPDWLLRVGAAGLAPADVQATLSELTAASIANAVAEHAPDTSSVFVCGGGVHNTELMRRLHARLGDVRLDSTAAVGLDPDWVEATAFAWLALRTLSGLPGNLPSVTGAERPVVLGTVHRP